jgi:hypothetical protein
VQLSNGTIVFAAPHSSTVFILQDLELAGPQGSMQHGQACGMAARSDSYYYTEVIRGNPRPFEAFRLDDGMQE